MSRRSTTKPSPKPRGLQPNARRDVHNMNEPTANLVQSADVLPASQPLLPTPEVNTSSSSPTLLEKREAPSVPQCDPIRPPFVFGSSSSAHAVNQPAFPEYKNPFHSVEPRQPIKRRDSRSPRGLRNRDSRSRSSSVVHSQIEKFFRDWERKHCPSEVKIVTPPSESPPSVLFPSISPIAAVIPQVASPPAPPSIITPPTPPNVPVNPSPPHDSSDDDDDEPVKVDTEEYWRAAYKYVPSVRSAECPEFRALKREGIVPKINTSKTQAANHPHPAGAVSRAILTAHALGSLWKRGNDDIVSHYGAPRDESIHKAIIDSMPNPKTDPAPNLQVYRPIVAPADILRTSTSSAFVDSRKKIWTRAGALFVDIYLFPKREFSAENLYDYMRKYKIQHAAWIGHRFTGDYGVANSESAWHRDADGLIHYVSDAKQSQYAPHDPLDWLWTGNAYNDHDGRRTLAWCHQEAVADMHLIYFTIVDGIIVSDVLPPKATEIVTKEVDFLQPANWIPYPVVTWPLLIKYVPLSFRKYSFFFEKRTITTVASLFNSLTSQIAPRTRNEANFRSFLELTQKTVNEDPKLNLLVQSFPDKFEGLAYETGIAAFTYNLERQALSQTMLAEYVQTHMPDATVKLKSMDQPRYIPTKPWSWKTLAWQTAGIATLAAACYCGRNYIPKAVRYLVSKITPMSFLGGAIENPCDPDSHAGGLIKIMRKSMLGGFLGIVVLAPIMEECFKHAPYIGLPMTCFYSCAEYFLKGGDLRPFVFHYTTQRMPLRHAIVFHMIWNAIAFAALQKTIFDQDNAAADLITAAAFPFNYQVDSWMHNHFLLPWQVRPALFTGAINREPFSPSQGFLPQQNGFNPEPMQDETYKRFHSSLCLEVPNQTVKTNAFYFLPTDVPFYVPARTNYNLLFIVKQRLLVSPPMDHDDQMKNWSTLPLLPISFHFPIIWEMHVHPWLEHFKQGFKRRKYAQAYSIHKTNGDAEIQIDKISVKGFTKTNEALCRLDDVDNLRLRPRMVTDLPAKLQLKIGPECLEVSQRMKNFFCVDPAPVYWLDCFYYITFACGFTDYDLTQWAAAITLRPIGTISVIVSGDDSLIVLHTADGNRYLEGDAKMFDQSQGAGPLTFQHKTFAQFGMSDPCCDLLRAISAAPYVLKDISKDHVGKIIVNQVESQMRVTGGPDTTNGNSLIMAVACCYAANTFEDLIVIKERFLFLGFEMKLKEHSLLACCTFLKGMFYPATNSPYYHYWGKLPSQLLKIGKSYRDPRTLYQIKALKTDLEAATYQFANDLACGLAPFLPVPGLRAFQAYNNVPALRSFVEDHHIQSASMTFPDWLSFNWFYICKRYDLSPDDWYEIEEQIRGGLFHLLQHPGYLKMARADYL